MPKKVPARIGNKPKGFYAKQKLEAQKRKAAKFKENKAESTSSLQSEEVPQFFVPQQELCDVSGHPTPVIMEISCDSIRGSDSKLHADVSDTELQADTWFWELPDFGIRHERSSSVEAVSPLVRSSAKEAEDYAVILDSVYTYSTNENVDDVVARLKPSFMNTLHRELQNCEFPNNWEVIRAANDVAIVQITTTSIGYPVTRKAIVVDGNRNMKVYIYNHLLNVHETWLKVISKLQISQSMKRTVAILSETVNAVNAATVCCGNFEDECIFFYKEKVRDKEEADRNCYIEWINFNEDAGDGTNYCCTVRSVNCNFLLKRYVRCTNCSKLRKSMKLTELRRQFVNPSEAVESASSHATFRTLTARQKDKRLKNLTIAVQKEKKTVKYLKQKISVGIMKSL